MSYLIFLLLPFPSCSVFPTQLPQLLFITCEQLHYSSVQNPSAAAHLTDRRDWHVYAIPTWSQPNSFQTPFPSAPFQIRRPTFWSSNKQCRHHQILYLFLVSKKNILQIAVWPSSFVQVIVQIHLVGEDFPDHQYKSNVKIVCLLDFPGGWAD